MRIKQDATKLVTIASIVASALLMQACASTAVDKTALKAGATAHANAQSDGSGLDPIASAAFWGTRYDREPQNPEAAVNFSAALRKIGSFDESMKVMSRVSNNFPEDADVMLEYGKSLIEGNRAFEAIRPIEFALAKRPDDWRILSAYGVALDQIGEHKSARLQYDRALLNNPTAISVLNNKGLSYAMSGDLNLARNTLVAATSNRRADAKVRQNLALVMALKGDITAAERLARSDLPPQLAENNVAYFRTLLNQPAYWQDFAASDVATPDFDAGSSFSQAPGFDNVPSVPSINVEPSFESEPLPKVGSTPQPVVEPEPLPLPLVIEEDETDENEGVPLVLGPLIVPSTASFADEFSGDETDETDTQDSDEESGEDSGDGNDIRE